MAVRVATASVWLAFGLLFKVFGLVPRHQEIVASVVGAAWSTPVTLAVGAAETLLAAWILSGLWPRVCMAMQTVAIVAMNAFEVTLARELLLAPLPMLLGNAAFLGAGWWAALTATWATMPPVRHTPAPPAPRT